MPPLLHAYGLGSFEMGVARTLSERTDDSGDRLDRESVGLLCHGVTAMAMAIGTISNLKLIRQTGTRILKTATIEKINKLLSFCTYR